MSQEHENARPTDNLSDEGKQALSALRGVWSAQAQSGAGMDESSGNTSMDESSGNTRSCKRMAEVGFQGLSEEVEGDPSAEKDQRAGWKTQLQREGKHAGGKSVRDLVLGSSEQQQQQ